VKALRGAELRCLDEGGLDSIRRFADARGALQAEVELIRAPEKPRPVNSDERAAARKAADAAEAAVRAASAAGQGVP
jgi:hypothetical protein